MNLPPQKSFGDFTAERFGRNWVYAARATDAIKARYTKWNPETEQHEPPTVIAPKQQRQLATDYAAEWGREYDSQFWAAICALRAIGGELAKEALQQMGVRP